MKTIKIQKNEGKKVIFQIVKKKPNAIPYNEVFKGNFL